MSMAALEHHPGMGGRWQALGAAFSIEAIGLAGLFAWWALHPSPPPLNRLPLVIEAPLAPTEEQPKPPEPPTPAPVVPSPPMPRATPRQTPAPTVVQEPQPTPVSEPVLAPSLPPAPVAAALPTASPPPAPPAPPAAPAVPAGPPADYVAKVRAAVQAAFVYPPAAAAMGFHGRARVGFTLHGLAPQGAHVLVSSGMAMVDRAALQSVQSAVYPPPPPELKGSDLSFEVWVEFKP